MTSAAARAFVLGLSLATLPACGSDLPTQPTVTFGEGVTLYPDSLFRGERVTLGGNVTNLGELRGPCGGDSDNKEWSDYDDCVSSLRIPQGWTAVVYRDRDFRGASATYTADVPDLDMVPGPCKPGFNDCISSIQVLRR